MRAAGILAVLFALVLGLISVFDLYRNFEKPFEANKAIHQDLVNGDKQAAYADYAKSEDTTYLLDGVLGIVAVGSLIAGIAMLSTANKQSAIQA